MKQGRSPGSIPNRPRRAPLGAPGSLIDPAASLGADVRVGAMALVGPQVTVGEGTVIEAHAILQGPAVIGRGNRIGLGTVLGQDPQDLKYKGEPTELFVGDGNLFEAYVTVGRGTVTGRGHTRIGHRNHLQAYAHVGHDCQIGNGVTIGTGSAVAGHVVVEDGVVIEELAGIHQFTHLGRFSRVKAHTMVNKDVPPYVVVQGNPARVIGFHEEGVEAAGLEPQVAAQIRRAYQILYESNLNVAQAIEQMESELTSGEEVEHFLRFLRNASRGVCR